MSNKTEYMDFHNIRLCSKYLILRKINAHFEFDGSSPSQDPGTGRASINIWELRRPAVRSQRRLRSSGLCIHNPATDSCLTSVFTQDLKGSRTRGWWITGRWFRRLLCQSRGVVRLSRHPRRKGRSGGGWTGSFLSSFLSAHRPAWKSCCKYA